jgi:transposase-like protein
LLLAILAAVRKKVGGNGSKAREAVNSSAWSNLTVITAAQIKLARNGLTQNSKQRYLCSDCGRTSRDDPQPNGYTEAERERILRAYHERSSLRGLSRTFGVSRQTVTAWLKKRGRTS